MQEEENKENGKKAGQRQRRQDGRKRRKMPRPAKQLEEKHGKCYNSGRPIRLQKAAGSKGG